MLTKGIKERGYPSSGGKNLIKNPGGGASAKKRGSYKEKILPARRGSASGNIQKIGRRLAVMSRHGHGYVPWKRPRIRLSDSFFTDKNRVIVYDDRSCNVFARPGNRIEKSAGA